jgi:nitronate monooxygenase
MPSGREHGKRFNDLVAGLRLPVIVAPMFLISGVEMVTAACRAGVIGCFPAPNARTIDDLDQWCREIARRTEGAAPWAMNMLTHSTYARFDEEAEVVRRHKPPLLVTCLGSPARIADTVHGYGGLVFADVNTPALARKAVESGADGLILLCSGAGGHTGIYSAFAFLREVREFWDGPIVLSGGVGDARGVLAAEVLGAELVYMGTRFLASAESLGEPDRKAMTVRVGLEDIVASKAVTGVLANWMQPSLDAAGFVLSDMPARPVDFTTAEKAKPWKNIWGAGQVVGAVKGIEPVAAIIDDLAEEYAALCGQWAVRLERAGSAEKLQHA